MDPSPFVQRLSSFSAEALKHDPATRKEALNISRTLSSSLQDPVREATELAFSFFIPVTTRIAVDLNLFKHISECVEPLNSKQLGEITGGEPQLISRVLRLLAGIGFVYESSPDHWTATPTTKAVATDSVAAGVRFLFDFLGVAAIKSPKYLRETKFNAPTEPSDGIIQYGHQTKLPSFEIMAASPVFLKDFNDFMGYCMGVSSFWVDWYPIKERLLDGYDKETKLLVDIAGGTGADLQRFHKKFPEQKGLVLQELPQAIDNIRAEELDLSVERMVHDFFTPQPIKGARAYFLHKIMHDWSDKYCVKILTHIRAAMVPGYSVLLLHDWILPDRGASTFQAIYDMTMMTFNGGIERSRSQWKELLDQAGLDVVKFWIEDKDADGIVEAVPKKVETVVDISG